MLGDILARAAVKQLELEQKVSTRLATRDDRKAAREQEKLAKKAQTEREKTLRAEYLAHLQNERSQKDS